MAVTVLIPTPLQRLTSGVGEATVSGSTVGEIIGDLDRQYPGVRDRLCNPETGRLRRFANVYLNSEDIRHLQNEETLVKDGDELSIVPAVAGG